MNTEEPRGQIITFYSYKGGTGRSMALANIACILAERQTLARGKGVLMIDWDLEAPGLHRYFGSRLSTMAFNLVGVDGREAHNHAPGLIDLFYELNKQVDSSIEVAQASGTIGSSEQAAREAISRIRFSDFILPTTISGLSLLKAGRFTSKDPNEYSERVNKFNWEALFKKSPHLLRVFAETLAKDYSYVLIDSRTGITDISGITTMLLPEKLVIVFTPNLQSLKGGVELVRKATEYRKESVDLRPLTVFPLVSRVEANEPELRHDWRFGNLETAGYQREFEKVLSEVYGEKIALNKYFDELQIQHIPRYAYGEEVAVLIEKTLDRFSLRRSYQSFAFKLIEPHAPWEGEIARESDFDERASRYKDTINRLVDVVSLKYVSSPVRLLFVIAALLGFVTLTITSYEDLKKAQASERSLQQQLQQAQNENAQLNQQVHELKDPIKGILAENNKRIEALTQQLSDVSKQRDAAAQDAQTQRDSVAQIRLQADRAAQAQKQAQTTLTACQTDRNDIQSAYRDALSKYSASQSEVRRLEAQVAKCRP